MKRMANRPYPHPFMKAQTESASIEEEALDMMKSLKPQLNTGGAAKQSKASGEPAATQAAGRGGWRDYLPCPLRVYLISSLLRKAALTPKQFTAFYLGI